MKFLQNILIVAILFVVALILFGKTEVLFSRTSVVPSLEEISEIDSTEEVEILEEVTVEPKPEPVPRKTTEVKPAPVINKPQESTPVVAKSEPEVIEEVVVEPEPEPVAETSSSPTKSQSASSGLPATNPVSVLPASLNMFYFSPPGEDFLAHLKMDVQPWIKWGVSPKDPTTKEERIQMVAQTELGRRSLDYLGYSY